MNTFFVRTTPGIEAITAAELVGLGLQPEKPGETTAAPFPGSNDLSFQGEWEALYRANLHLRTATAVLVRVGMPFMARTFPELVERASHLPWERFLVRGQTITLRVDSRGSKLYHEEAIAERIMTSIEARMGTPSPRKRSGDEEDRGPAPQLIDVRVIENRCTVCIDSSGEPLHRRAYRLASAKAPLREDLAAAILIASGWDRQSPLLDPFCGSGTIPIEAALLARGIAPGIHRRSFAFMNWPGHNKSLWRKLCAEATEAVVHDLPPILASDRDAGAVRMAHENAERAGVSDCIAISCAAVSAMHAPGTPGWIVTNPPYGVRVSEGKDLRNLYASLGSVLKRNCKGWHVAILSSNTALLRHTRLQLESSLSFTHGGLRVHLGRGIIE